MKGIVLALFPMLVAGPLAAATPDLDPANATWHVGLADLWGGGKNLDLYVTFEDGRWARALGSARTYNTSIHLVEQSDVVFDGRRLAGRLEVIITPDRWVPKDGRPVALEAEIKGTLSPGPGEPAWTLSGTYRGRLGGEDIQGKLIGAVGPTETGWDDSVWRFPLNPVVEPGGMDRPSVEVTIGVAGGKVHWGTAGLTWRRGAQRVYPFDTSGLDLDGATVTGAFTVPNRVIHVAGDPEAVCRFDFVGHRVQGLSGAGAKISTLRPGGAEVRDPFSAYGKGTCRKGGGRGSADAPKPLWRHDVDNAPWYVPVKGYRPPAAGEHPRLLFRKGDVAALRRKAATPEGKAIVARLRRLLDGADGDSLPTTFNQTPPHNHNQSPYLPVGSFTTWHGAGYAMLYQLTGEQRYADLARRAVELCFEGKIDRDNRYAWFKPGTDMRAGSVLGAVAYAYDMAYDGWPDAFRRKVARELQTYEKVHASGEAKGDRVSILELCGRSGYPPSSNHYGSMIGGTGVALLAIRGDPGVDTPWVEARLEEIESVCLPFMLSYGFGDHGWYSEGHHPSRVSSSGGVLELLQALRVAAGRDYITPRANSQWITLRWVMEVTGSGSPQIPHRGTYGNDGLYSRAPMLSHSAEFAFGFGAVDRKFAPAVLWTYKTFIEPWEKGSSPKWVNQGERSYNAFVYPHHAVYALVNWPVGVEPANPETVLPKAMADTTHGYFVCRNRWKDARDIIITNLLNIGQEGYHRVKNGGVIRIWGLGRRENWKTDLGGGTPVAWEPMEDGSSVLSVSKGGISSLAIDFSGASGAAALVVGTGPAFEKARTPRNLAFTEVTAGGRKFAVVTLQEGEAPKPKADGDAVRIGRQKVRFDGTRLVLGPSGR